MHENDIGAEICQKCNARYGFKIRNPMPRIIMITLFLSAALFFAVLGYLINSGNSSNINISDGWGFLLIGAGVVGSVLGIPAIFELAWSYFRGKRWWKNL